MDVIDRFITSVGLGMAKRMTNRTGNTVRSRVTKSAGGWNLTLEDSRGAPTGTKVFNISATTGAIPVIRAEEETGPDEALEEELQDIMRESWSRFAKQMVRVELR